MQHPALHALDRERYQAYLDTGSMPRDVGLLVLYNIAFISQQAQNNVLLTT